MGRLPTIPPRRPDATEADESARMRRIHDRTMTAHVHVWRPAMARLSGGGVPCLECTCGEREYTIPR